MDAFKEVSRGVAKIKQADYLSRGRHPIIDQGKGMIAGYSNAEEGLFTDVPAIVFGDHTRCVKYVSESFFAGADGVKILKPLLSDNVRYWYHALRSVRLDNLGYSRHYKLLKQTTFACVDEDIQSVVCDVLDSILAAANLARRQLSLLDDLVKSRFVEMFRDVSNGNAIPLKECCSTIQGGKTPSMKHPEYYGGTVPFIKSGDVKGDGVSSGALWLSDVAIERAGVKLVKRGSVLVVTRSALLQRKVCSALCTADVAINQDIKAFTPRDGFSGDYLLWAIRSHEKRLLAGVRSVSTSALDFDDLCCLPVKIASIAEQREFAAFAAEVDKSRVVVQQQVLKYNDVIRASSETAIIRRGGLA